MNVVNIGYRSTNYYVLSEGSPKLLVDAGWPGMLSQFRHAANRMSISLESIPYQLVTHYHPDHAGLVEDLKRLGTKLIVLDTQVAHIPLLRSYVKPEDSYTDIQIVGSTILSEESSRAFLASVGVQGLILSTPGHSDDSVTLILDQGAAFTGDLTNPQVVPDDPDDAAYRSWQRIRAMGANLIYPGHGPAWAI